MTFIDATAKRLGIPHARIRRATRKLLDHLCLHNDADDFDAVLRHVPEFATGLGGPPLGRPRTRFDRWLRKLQRATQSPHSLSMALVTIGLGDRHVAFASAFAKHLKKHLDNAFVDRLLANVPGLQPISGWPLEPHRPPRPPEEPPAPAHS